MSTEHNSPRRYAEDVDLDSQFPGAALRAPEPEHDSPEPVEMSGVDALPEDLDPDYAEFLRQKKAKASVIPDHAPRPQDRKAKASDEPEEEYPNAVMDEATGILMVTIHHDGMELTIPADPEDWPIQATLAFEDGKILNAIRALLSPREFNKVLAKNYRNKDFGKLYERLAKAGGFDNPGN